MNFSWDYSDANDAYVFQKVEGIWTLIGIISSTTAGATPVAITAGGAIAAGFQDHGIVKRDGYCGLEVGELCYDVTSSGGVRLLNLA